MCFNCKNHLEKQLALFEQGNALMNSIDSLIYAMCTNCLYVCILWVARIKLLLTFINQKTFLLHSITRIFSARVYDRTHKTKPSLVCNVRVRRILFNTEKILPPSNNNVSEKNRTTAHTHTKDLWYPKKLIQIFLYIFVWWGNEVTIYTTFSVKKSEFIMRVVWRI